MKTIAIILLFILIIIVSIFAKDERDNLRYKNKHVLFPNWKWYTENRYDTKSFWIKNVFTLFNDGDNWWEWWNELIKYYAIAYAEKNKNV